MNARRILMLISIALAVCVTGATAETNTVTIEDVTLQPGATQEVPIRLLGSTGVGGVAVTLTFSPSVANVTSVVAGDFDDMFTPDYSNVNNGVLKVTSMKSGQDLTGDLVIATITLGALGDGGSCELGLHAELTDRSGNAVPSSVDSGTLTVGTGATTPDEVPGNDAFEVGDSPATPTATTTPAATATAVKTAKPALTKKPVAGTTPAAGDEMTPAKPEKKGLPGFEGAIAIAGLLAIAYMIMRRKR
jgi:PGF-CTERM protein